MINKFKIRVKVAIASTYVNATNKTERKHPI